MLDLFLILTIYQNYTLVYNSIFNTMGWLKHELDFFFFWRPRISTIYYFCFYKISLKLNLIEDWGRRLTVMYDGEGNLGEIQIHGPKIQWLNL